jgi:oligopeptide/dipeptide ABC transporter ATP-binding protein
MPTVINRIKEGIEVESQYGNVSFYQSAPVLEIKNLSISLKENTLVKNLNLAIRPGEMLGLVGESGSGKSLTATAILGLLPKAMKVSEGQILMGGIDLASLSEKEMRRIRGKEIAYIFQNYQGSFTPFIKLGKQLVETIRSHHEISKTDAKTKALIWLERVQLPAERIFGSYPHQLSGGQLQRSSLAAALMLSPALIIADEPTTALDVLSGERILDLLVDLQKDLKCAVLLISHDLKHVLKRTDSMAVMYGGQIVEMGLTKSIGMFPIHPYTKLLLQAKPVLSMDVPEKLAAIPGEPGLVAEHGCSFSLRCPKSFEQCSSIPTMKNAGIFRWNACHAVGANGGDLNVASQKSN